MMSDAEAGESEGPENPQPEDEAQLSTLGAQVIPGTSLAPSSPQCAQLQACDHTAGDTSSRLAGDVEESVTHSEHVTTTASHEESVDGGDSGEVVTVQGVDSCDQGGPGERREEETQQAWPPESDRAVSGHPEGNHSAGSTGDDAETQKIDVGETICEDGGDGCVDPSEDSEMIPQSVENEGLALAVSSDHWDQEESPPEDELFAQQPLSNAEQGSGAEDVAGDDSARDSDDIQNDHSSLAAPLSTADMHASGLQQGSSAQSSSPTVAPSLHGVPSSDAMAEKEVDQVPECDRESLPQSPQVASAHIAGPDPCDADHVHSPESLCCDGHGGDSDSSPDERLLPKHGSALSNSCGDSSILHQSGSPTPNDNIHRPVPCDSSSNCETAAYQHSSTSPQYQSPESQRSQESASSRQEEETQRKPYFLDDDSEEEELLTELDAELHLRCSPEGQQRRSASGAVRLSLNGLKDVDMNNSELCKQFEEQLLQLQETVLQREREINKLKAEKSRQREVSQEVIAERDRLRSELTLLKDKNPDDLYLPQIKELEYTLSQQQGEIRLLKEKLTAHDAAAKRAIATLQSEMKARIDQITKLYEESCREKDSMVVKFAQAETKNMEAKYAEEKMEARVRDLLKEKEFTTNKMRAAMGEKQKAVAELKAKMGEMGAAQKELEKVKEELSSADYRIKWHQNKLKAELDAHKETKVNLEKTTAKLKEAKEETEMIRKDCQAIVKTYQESEEVRSNSLDKELKMKETELMIKTKEYSDTEEIHLKTKQELDALKAHHKDAMEELKALKDKVQCLEEERLQGEQVQAKYQTIIQNQKSDNTSLAKQLATLQTLQEDFDRAQDMIKSLDSEVSSLKLTNRDLQKDSEGCQARESKMLTLQSELSRTNALLRSENTSLSNQVATLSGEVQKLTMDIQDLDTRCRNMGDQLEEERSKRQEEASSLSAQLAIKCKESEDFKQKWEDEIDASKTWKRKHTSNVKDLTRQLQQAKKRLEAFESGGGGGSGGSGERDVTSMGSRTNSNGSLNSMDNSSNQHPSHPAHPAPHTHHLHVQANNLPPRQPSQEPEFPVIREQVEVDRQLLIERIVKLQRALARKNEKLDFVEEHTQQLVQEIKKKKKIIQGYVMREEAGTLASDTMDANKLSVRKEAQALLSRKGGIMASVYSHHQQDGAMTLDLSLQINQKLQAVLEDTLLKNITLKENLDTLGAEIARLSQENRRLQLHLQGLHTQ